MKKILSIVTALALVMSLTNFAFAADKDTSVQDDRAMNSGTEIAYIDSDVLDLSVAEERKTEQFNRGLVSELQSTDYTPSVDEKGIWKSNDEIIEAIEGYCDSHYDPMSGAIYKEALELTDNDSIKIDIDEESSEYLENVQKYNINDSMAVTITPDVIYLDEYVENPIIKSASTNAKASWKYKNVATRRTLIYKVTVKGKTYSFKIYSVHTGGEVKYNGSKAKHSAAYYAYNLQEAYGSPFKFKQIAKQNEQISGTSWHYKYMGKVTGSISITVPIKLKISFKEKALGCQAITDKKGKGTKNTGRHFKQVR